MDAVMVASLPHGDLELLVAVFDALPDQAVLVTDAHHVVVIAGADVRHVFDAAPGELTGRPLTTLVEMPDGMDAGMLFCQTRGAVRAVRHADGSRHPVAVSAGPIRDAHGRVTGGVVIARRLAEDGAANALGEVERQWAEFAAAVSHELRTPLTSVIGNTEMLLDGDAGPLSEPAQRLVAAVDRNARRLQSLVGDLLLAYRLEARPLRENARPVVLHGVVERVVRRLAATPAGRDVHLDMHRPARPVLAHADPDDVERLVGVLVDNAVRFTPAGATVRIGLDRAGGYARLRVSHAGAHDHVSEPDRAPDGAGEPSASGLAAARAMVEDLAGAIRVVTGADGGTLVEVDLPAATRAESSPVRGAPAPRTP